MIINDVELELDLMDADVLDLVQDALGNLTTESEKSERVSDMIRQPCITINTFFDTVFGEGASDAVFQGKMSLTDHMDAFMQIVTEIEKAPESINGSMDKYLKVVKKKPAVIKTMDHLPKTRPATKKKFSSVKK
ncbi:DUF6673 family protein [Acetobacterium bakii]|uniref:DUF6673 domain-containing protein n=1 Tax=Acetobacterium bakii TaxID=52689 RepID=A0A0L6TYX1_9FIRM|nr:DUF6673 family protein [Acetobacterium bakii]KNZ41459.1 hypothetical protein AKG39_11865 [Acetobacterium bakii]